MGMCNKGERWTTTGKLARENKEAGLVGNAGTYNIERNRRVSIGALAIMECCIKGTTTFIWQEGIIS